MSSLAPTALVRQVDRAEVPAAGTYVIDASHSLWEEQRQVVDRVLAELELQDRPVLHVFNKVDRIGHDQLVAMQERIRNLLPNSVFVSAVSEDGIDPLVRALLVEIRKLRPVSEIRLPISDGKLLAEIHRGGEVLGQRTEGAELVITARVDEAMAGRLRAHGAGVRAG